ncbi:MAG: hypothetical protein A2Z88_05055 [Omnitrophica WOR_2 bacterium GWA2_47_8]|nr:MAG: hypothetical protein A2Z88_05055 [Omnitrophica WOR_2 bacterium GWA2_47_8]
MSKELRNRILTSLGVLVFCLYFAFPLEKRINLGLDLKGGMHLLLRVDTSKAAGANKNDAVLRAIEILRNRIDSLGVGETVIQRQGEEQILVQLPGITDRNKALNIIGQVALLEFKLVNSDPVALKEALAGNVPANSELKKLKDKGEQLLVFKDIAMKGEYVKDAKVDFDQFGGSKISIAMNSEGAKIFGKITTDHVNEGLAIIVDDVILSAPNINEPILSGTGEITGDFTFEEASTLALQLRSGALPAPMHIEEERTVGPLLGKDSIEAGIKSALLGIAFVFGFMLLYYGIAGLVADLGLLFNLFIVLGTMGFLNVMLPDAQMTLTLPGIAGIILTIGMAVDANILINERIREEIENGRSLSAALNNGFNKAFSAIFDSNLTTLIAAFMLFQFGSGPIKGFAVTLAIGLICSLFTAVFVTKTLFLLLLQLGWIKSLRMHKLFTGMKFNYLSMGWFCISLSVIIIVLSMVNLFNKKDAAYGIDFAGGQIQEFRFSKPVATDELRDLFKEADLKDVTIQRFDQTPENVILRSSDDIHDKVVQLFNEKLPDDKFEVLRIEKVGPVVGKALRGKAMLAMIFALLGILVYVGFRFKHFDFATGGVVALLHDVIITLGLIVVFGRQVDLLVVTALLTIAGYSINDTIVIYDRVRENMINMRKAPLAEILNTSLNQTLSRTILTNFATFLVILSLYFWGGEVLNTFALCLWIGFIAGTYSTVFIASPIVLAMQKKK